MATDTRPADPQSLWQRLADDDGNGGDLMVVVAILVVAGALAGAISAFSSSAAGWAKNLSDVITEGLQKARGTGGTATTTTPPAGT